ncbi:MAG: phage tail protein [Scytonematopsis contorta HA4267-MV1]|jgi:phage tail-like protein|nr:phage tail protein [Scytonematopsis contorta HA4267-MV1]
MTNFSQIIQMQLTPLVIPDTVQVSKNGALATRNEAFLTPSQNLSGCNLLVYPREPSEILLQLENLGTRTLRLNIRLEGSFPTEWCRIGMEGYELAPRGRMDVLLYFQVPENFFENQTDLQAGQSLVLDYQSRIQVYYTEEGTGRQLVETAAFNLYVRPRSLYLNFVPALYREIDFIGRFLKIFEQAFEPAVQALDVLWAYLDPKTTPEALLPFLAHWVALPLDPRWSVQQQRNLIQRAIELYTWRGTRRGLRLYIHLYTNLPLDEHITTETDKHICIEEIHAQGLVIGKTHLGEDSMIGGGRPYHFIVRLHPETSDHNIDEQLIRKIIEQEKPAFCTYELHIQT